MRYVLAVLIIAELSVSYSQAEMVFASNVVSFSGTSRGQISNILGPNDGEWVEVSGQPSFAILGFGQSFYDAPGNDINVYLRNWDDPEDFILSASDDGVTFSQVGIFDPATYPGNNPPPLNFTVSADLGASGLSVANFIRLESVTPANTSVQFLPEYDAVSVTAVPEPTSGCLFACLAVACFARKRRENSAVGLTLKP